MRLFPTKEEKSKLSEICDQFRWYYNTAVHITNKYETQELQDKTGHFINSKVRDFIDKFEYMEKTVDNVLIRKFKYNPENKNCRAPWWKNIHSRVPRGAYYKFTASINSAVSNYQNGNIKNFKMSFKSKKDSTDMAFFEDKGFPAFIKKIKSRYWYRTKEHKRNTLTFENIFNSSPRGLEIFHDKPKDQYFLLYPIEVDWFPDDDLRLESQKTLFRKGKRLISLDPGVRKFMVGYDPSGKMVFIGEGANKLLMTKLKEIDKMCSKKKNTREKWKNVKNLVTELHWKTIAFLIKNYDIIILPDFRISEMVKGKKLTRSTKRMLYMYSFDKFKERIKYKAKVYKKNLVIVDESYTSKTCGRCGELNNVGGSEEYRCEKCGIAMDRDVNGSRNILIKNLRWVEKSK